VHLDLDVEVEPLVGAIEKSHFEGFTFVGEGGALAHAAAAGGGGDDDEDELLRRELHRRSGSGAGADHDADADADADIDGHLAATSPPERYGRASELSDSRQLSPSGVGSPGDAGAISDGPGGSHNAARSDDGW
jgi:hypothetical protein